MTAAEATRSWPERLPAEMDLLHLPFDQYQRYAYAADLLRLLGLGDGARVLEVGAAPGPLERFLPEMDLFFTDREGTHAGRYVIADGARLPFRDGAVDAVVTLDTLEHVPPQDREAFLAECRRVSGDLVVLSAPHASPYVDLAEDTLHAFVKTRFGTSFAFLEEHRGNGLPVVEQTLASLAEGGWQSVRMPSGYLPHWVLAMLVHHELLASGFTELPELHAYYNATVSPADARDPSYGQVVLAGRDRPVAELQAAVDALTTRGDEVAAQATLLGIGGSVLSARLSSPAAGRLSDLTARLEAAQAQVAGLERVVADRDAHLLELRAQVAHLVGQDIEREQTVRQDLAGLREDVRTRGLAGLARSTVRAVRSARSTRSSTP